MAWLAPLAGVLVAWWMSGVNPCLDDEIGNLLRARNPPVAIAESEARLPLDAVDVENPYGIVACDYFPDAADHVISIASLVAIALLVGFLAARRFQQHARVRASLITFVWLLLAMAFSLLVYAPDILSSLEWTGYKQLLIEILLELAFVFGAASVAWFGAALTLRLRSRD